MTQMEMPSETTPRRLALLLIDGFALMSYASLIEPFRAANLLSGKELYRWQHVSVGGDRAHASNGARIVADKKVGEEVECDALFVFAAGNPAAFHDTQTFAWLRSMARRGATIAGISGGPYVLARSGLLAEYRATIHWEHQAQFAEDFPLLALETGLYVIDRKRVTCAGGTAAMDLAIDLIERDYGSALAGRVSEWFIRTDARTAERPQRLGIRERYGVANETVMRALAAMEAQIEAPLPRDELANLVGVTARQLDRLFVSHMGQTASATYSAIRLQQARDLLRKTTMSVTETGLACGFASTSHFSRCYRQEFGKPPRRDRI